MPHRSKTNPFNTLRITTKTIGKALMRRMFTLLLRMRNMLS